MSEKVYQIAVIGDALVGKTSFLKSFYNEEKFSDYHLSTICDKEITDIKVDTSTYKVKLIDTTGQIGIENIDVDCFILCYSIENPLKTDLRDELPNVPFLTFNDCQILCEEVGGKKFIETSAKENINIKAAVETALKTVIPVATSPIPKAIPITVVSSVESEKKSSVCCGCC